MDQEEASGLIAKYGLTYGQGNEINTRYAAVKKRKAIVVGFNPGAADRKPGEAANVVQDVIAGLPKLSRSEKSWRTKCANLVGAWPHEIALIELIDISTYNVGELMTNGHDWRDELVKNASRNLEKIAHHEPDIIFQTGISPDHIEATKNAFQLKHTDDLKTGSRLVAKLFELKVGGRVIPWIAVRHISQNFSGADRILVHEYVDRKLGKAGVTGR